MNGGEFMQRSRLRVSRIVGYLVLLLMAWAILYPVLLVVVGSFASESSLIKFGYSLVPHQLSLAAYKAIFQGGQVADSYLTTVFFTIVGTFLSLVVTSAAAYALSGNRLYNRNKFALFFYITMMFTGGLVPQYILITRYLHLTNSIWVYIIPVLLNPWNMFLMRNFFNDLPKDLFESARIDGAREITILVRIVLPLSLPAIATIGLFYAVGYWGEWMNAMLYVSDRHLWSLQYLIVNMIDNISTAQNIADAASTNVMPPSYTVRLATAAITMGPIVILFPFLQRFFVSGLKVGAVKG